MPTSFAEAFLCGSELHRLEQEEKALQRYWKWRIRWWDLRDAILQKFGRDPHKIEGFGD